MARELILPGGRKVQIGEQGEPPPGFRGLMVYLVPEPEGKVGLGFRFISIDRATAGYIGEHMLEMYDSIKAGEEPAEGPVQ